MQYQSFACPHCLTSLPNLVHTGVYSPQPRGAAASCRRGSPPSRGAWCSTWMTRTRTWKTANRRMTVAQSLMQVRTKLGVCARLCTSVCAYVRWIGVVFWMFRMDQARLWVAQTFWALCKHGIAVGVCGSLHAPGMLSCCSVCCDAAVCVQGLRRATTATWRAWRTRWARRRRALRMRGARIQKRAVVARSRRANRAAASASWRCVHMCVYVCACMCVGIRVHACVCARVFF